MKFIDLTQDFSLHTPAFAGYAGPAIRWIKRLAFDKAGGQEITMTLHVSTHLDSPAHFYSGGKFIGDQTAWYQSKALSGNRRADHQRIKAKMRDAFRSEIGNVMCLGKLFPAQRCRQDPPAHLCARR